jgi:hypothetical protein
MANSNPRKSFLLCKTTPNALAVFGLAFGLLGACQKSPRAVLETTTGTPSCNSYSITTKASGLVPGTDYQIDWLITEKPTSGSPTTIANEFKFVAPENGTFTTTRTYPLGPLNGAYSFSGYATLVGFNTVAITFTPSSVNCAGPPPPSASPR